MCAVYIETGQTSQFKNHCVSVWAPADPGAPISVRRVVVIAQCLHFPLLQGRDAAAFAAKMRRGFWPALQMNWRVWTPVQFININYVPLQVRPARHRAEPEGLQPPPKAISPQPFFLQQSGFLEPPCRPHSGFLPGRSCRPESLSFGFGALSQVVPTLCPCIPQVFTKAPVQGQRSGVSGDEGFPVPRGGQCHEAQEAGRGGLTCSDVRATPERQGGGAGPGQSAERTRHLGYERLALWAPGAAVGGWRGGWGRSERGGSREGLSRKRPPGPPQSGRSWPALVPHKCGPPATPPGEASTPWVAGLTIIQSLHAEHGPSMSGAQDHSQGWRFAGRAHGLDL